MKFAQKYSGVPGGRLFGNMFSSLVKQKLANNFDVILAKIVNVRLGSEQFHSPKSKLLFCESLKKCYAQNFTLNCKNKAMITKLTKHVSGLPIVNNFIRPSQTAAFSTFAA